MAQKLRDVCNKAIDFIQTLDELISSEEISQSLIQNRFQNRIGRLLHLVEPLEEARFHNNSAYGTVQVMVSFRSFQ